MARKMTRKGSRYEHTRGFFPGAEKEEAFAGLRPREIGPARGVLEHIVKAGDRPDLLARHYYNDDRLWWRIVDANPEIVFAGELLDERKEGSVILIPKVKE